MTRLSILVAYMAGLLSLLPTLAVAIISAAIACVGLRFVVQLLHLLMS